MGVVSFFLSKPVRFVIIPLAGAVDKYLVTFTDSKLAIVTMMNCKITYRKTGVAL